MVEVEIDFVDVPWQTMTSYEIIGNVTGMSLTEQKVILMLVAKITIDTTILFSSSRRHIGASFIFMHHLKRLKSDSHVPKIFCFNESPLKRMKKAFYFIFKVCSFSFSRYLSFCHDFLAKQKNGLIRNTWFISRFMTSQPG